MKAKFYFDTPSKYKTKHNMQEDPSSVFNQPEFKASLAKYEQMMQDGIRVYFEAEELTLIAEYYARSISH